MLGIFIEIKNKFLIAPNSFTHPIISTQNDFLSVRLHACCCKSQKQPHIYCAHWSKYLFRVRCGQKCTEETLRMFIRCCVSTPLNRGSHARQHSVGGVLNVEGLKPNPKARGPLTASGWHMASATPPHTGTLLSVPDPTQWRKINLHTETEEGGRDAFRKETHLTKFRQLATTFKRWCNSYNSI